MSRSTAKATLEQRSGDPATKWLTPTRLKETVDVVYDDMPTDGGASSAVSPMDYGAVGDGVADDTAALQAALDALVPGSMLWIPEGSTFRHTDDLSVVGIDNIVITGGGTIAHDSDVTNTCALRVENCNDVLVENLILTSTATTRRYGDEHRLFLRGCTRIDVRDITINGAAAGGLHFDDCHYFTADRISVSHSLADSVHCTHASSYGTISNITSDYSGDDGVAIVSYDQPGRTVCHHIDVSNVLVTNQIWGRGVSIVGGEDITMDNVFINGSCMAGVYIACESEFTTFGVARVRLTNFTLRNTMQQAASVPADRPRPDIEQMQQGSIMVYSNRSGLAVTDVYMNNFDIADVEPDCWYPGWQYVTYDAVGKVIDKIELDVATLEVGASYATTPGSVSAVPSGNYTFRDIVCNSVKLTDHIGFSPAERRPLYTVGGVMSGAIELSGAPTKRVHASDKGYVDDIARYSGSLLSGVWTKVTPDPAPVGPTGTMSMEWDSGSGGRYLVRIQHLLETGGRDILTNFQELQKNFLTYDEALKTWVSVTDADGVTFTGKMTATPNTGLGYGLWMFFVAGTGSETLPANGPVTVRFSKDTPLPTAIVASTVTASTSVTATNGTTSTVATPTGLTAPYIYSAGNIDVGASLIADVKVESPLTRTTDGSHTFTVTPTYASGGSFYGSADSNLAWGNTGNEMVQLGATTVARNGATGSQAVLSVRQNSTDGSYVFNVRGDGATKIGAAVNSDDAVQKGQIKTIVAASADFADFQTRMAAW